MTHDVDMLKPKRWQWLGFGMLAAVIVAIKIGGVVSDVVVVAVIGAFAVGLAYEAVREIRRADR